MSPKKLSTLYLTALGVNAIIGSGIFLSSGHIAKELGIYSILAFILAALLLNFVALTFSQLATLTSRNGGIYLYAQLAFGKKISFIVGWVAWFSAVVSCGAVSSALGHYLAYFFELSLSVQRILSLLIIFLFGVLNTRGILFGSRVMLGLTFLKILPLMALIFFGVFSFYQGSISVSLPSSDFKILSSSFLLILFTCQGFEVVPILAGETKEPQKTVPKAITYSLWISVILYCLLQMGISISPAVGSDKPLADMATHFWGSIGGKIIAFTGVISILGFISGLILAAPRFLIPLSEDGLLPQRFQNQNHSIWATTFSAMAFVYFSSVRELMTLSAVSIAFEYLVASAALFVISKRVRSSKIFLSILSILVSFLFLSQASFKTSVSFLFILFCGIIFQYRYQKKPTLLRLTP